MLPLNLAPSVFRHGRQCFYRSLRREFRSTGDQENLSLIGGGYLFDNVSITTADGPGPPGCDVPISKQADARTVSAGGLAGYRITVRNRGRASERNLLLCDHIPRNTTFVSADRKLLRLGRRRCLIIRRLRPGKRVSVHLTLRVNANALPGILDNIADITPIEPPLSPVFPPVLPPAIPPGATRPDVPGKITDITPIQKVKVVVRVVARRIVHPPAPPPVTG